MNKYKSGLRRIRNFGLSRRNFNKGLLGTAAAAGLATAGIPGTASAATDITFLGWEGYDAGLFVDSYLRIDDSNFEWYMLNSWVVEHEPNDYAHMHSHANSLISGVFYVQGQNTPTVFYREAEMFPLKFNYESYDLNIPNCTYKLIDVNPSENDYFYSTTYYLPMKEF